MIVVHLLFFSENKLLRTCRRQFLSITVKENNIVKTVLLKSDFTLQNASHFRVLEMLMSQNNTAK